MSPLKAHIIDYILKFISECGREVRISDLSDSIVQNFANELHEECNKVPFTDEMYSNSTIRETYEVYNLTYTAENDKLIGLNEEGHKVANHPKGILGYLKDKEKERKIIKLKSDIQTYTVV